MAKKILVVDDDALVLKSVQNLLKKQGYDVISANSGDTAKEKLFSSSIDLIISDIRMPGKDGITLIKELKEILKRKEAKEIPFIFITGYASEDAPIDAIKLGAKDYLLKPFDLDELMNSIKALIG